MKIEDDGNLTLHEIDVRPEYRGAIPVASMHPNHFTYEARIAAWYAVGAGQRYKLRYADTQQSGELNREPWGWINDPFARLDAIGADPNHPSHAIVREAIENKIDPPTPRDRLLEIRERAQGDSRWLDDLEFLLKLAVDQDDPYEDGPSDPEVLAARVQAMVLGNVWEDYLPRSPAPPREPRKRPAPIGPLVKVDVYECAEGHPGVRVEVERVPGSDEAKVGAHMEMERGAPTCPNCERDMIHVERKLRKVSK